MMNTELPIHLDPRVRIEVPLPKGWTRRWKDIVAQVCQEHRVTEEQLYSACRADHLTAARADLYWFAFRDTRLAIDEIARRTGGRDQSSVRNLVKHAIKRRGEPR